MSQGMTWEMTEQLGRQGHQDEQQGLSSNDHITQQGLSNMAARVQKVCFRRRTQMFPHMGTPFLPGALSSWEAAAFPRWAAMSAALSSCADLKLTVDDKPHISSQMVPT